jgi:hypothetical protein
MEVAACERLFVVLEAQNGRRLEDECLCFVEALSIPSESVSSREIAGRTMRQTAQRASRSVVYSKVHFGRWQRECSKLARTPPLSSKLSKETLQPPQLRMDSDIDQNDSAEDQQRMNVHFEITNGGCNRTCKG